MSYVSKLSINDTIYDLKDTEARESISALNTDLDSLFIDGKKWFEVNANGDLYYCYDDGEEA